MFFLSESTRLRPDRCHVFCFPIPSVATLGHTFSRETEMGQDGSAIGFNYVMCLLKVIFDFWPHYI